MPLYSKESLDNLRQRIDLVEVIGPHVELKRAGSAYKGLCPFHEEKTPSFGIQKGDRHYHCFGCGAHGDAIAFLMNYLNLGFGEAVENLAERFHVHLEVIEGNQDYQGPSKALQKTALDTASRFYHFSLLHTPEGHEALKYLYERGIDLDFVRQFQLGLAPNRSGVFRKLMHEKRVSDEVMVAAGLLLARDSGGYREFFRDRITFPIHNAAGAVIGFSARKYKEETFGGKYVNTSETPLFKKSRVLFGLNHSRRRIVKERRVIVVEGQVDALRLIHSGFNFTVAGQGTAFGEGHVKELMNLGVSEVFLALDSDEAGKEAATKIGHLFQKEGAEVRVLELPMGSDPDSYLMENGPDAFRLLLESSQPYLEFLVFHHGKTVNLQTPAGKNQLAQLLGKQIREWKHSVMIHEGLRQLAHFLQLPEELVGVGQDFVPNTHIRTSGSVGVQNVDPDRILESDFLRWVLMKGGQDPKYVIQAEMNIRPEGLRVPECSRIYQTYLQRYHQQELCDLLTLMDSEEDQALIANMMGKRVNVEKAKEHFEETIQKILERNWTVKREEVRLKIQSGQCSDDEAIALLKQFDELKNTPPEVCRVEGIA